MQPQIPALVSEPDNIERIRDHLARLLKCETENQCALALRQNAADAKIFDFRIFIENASPYDAEEELLNGPIVNISLKEVSAVQENARAGMQKQKAVFVIDCVAAWDESGAEWNARSAAMRAWGTARVIRRILMSAQYMYLRLRSIVGSRNIVSIQSLVKNDDSTPSVMVARITLEVVYLECAIDAELSVLEGIDYSVNPANGEVQKQ
jgi:hypothetical protein